MRLLQDGWHAEAEAPLGESLEIRQEALPEGHWLIFNTMSGLLNLMGKLPEAMPYWREALEASRRVPADGFVTAPTASMAAQGAYRRNVLPHR